MVERQGKTVMKHVISSGTRSLISQIERTVKKESQIYSDQLRAYTSLKKLGYLYGKVNHHLGEYVKGDVHTNTIEGVWSQLKRGIDGIYHHVSPNISKDTAMNMATAKIPVAPTPLWQVMLQDSLR